MSLINAISSFKVFQVPPKSENGANSVDFSPNGNYVMQMRILMRSVFLIGNGVL